MASRIALLVLFFPLFIVPLAGQGFEKITPLQHIARLVPAPGGGVLAAGAARDGAGLERLAVARYDANGTLLWFQQKDWTAQNATAFAVSPDDAGGWWIQGKPQVANTNAICNWHLDENGTELAFFTNNAYWDGLQDALLGGGDTLYVATGSGWLHYLLGGPVDLGSATSFYFRQFGPYSQTNNNFAFFVRALGGGEFVSGGASAVEGWNNWGPYLIDVVPFLFRFQPQQGTQTYHSYPQAGDQIVDFAAAAADANAVVISRKITNDSTFLMRLDADLNPVWIKGLSNRDFRKIVAAPDGSGFVVSGRTSDGSPSALLVKFDPAGNLLWERDLGSFAQTALTATDDGSFWVAAVSASTPARLIKTGADGWVRTNGLRGRLFQDDDQDCAFSPATEGGLGGFRLEFVTDGDTLTAFSQADGSFAFPADTGVQTLRIFTDNPGYVRCLPDPFIFNFISGYDTLELAAGFRDTCPDLTTQAKTDLACGPGAGRAAFQVTGGGGDYGFLWSNGATDSLLTNLNAGVYSVTISDGGCETYDTLELQFNYEALRLQQNNYGSSDYEQPAATAASPDGQYFYTVGRVNTPTLDVGSLHGGYDIWVVKTDRLGRKIWANTYGGTLFDEANDVKVAPDGTVWVTGNTDSQDGIFADTLLERHAFLLKLSPDGDLMWVQKVPTAFPNFQSATRLLLTPDGGYLIGGNVYNNAQDESFLWLARLDAAGETTWSHIYGGRAWPLRGDMLLDEVAGGYVLSVEVQEEGNGLEKLTRLFKVDLNGAVVWQTGGYALGRSALAQQADGSFLAGSSAPNAAGLYRPALAHLTAAGIVDTIYRLPTTTTDYVSHIVAAAAGGWSVLTYRQSYGPSTLIRLDAQFEPFAPEVTLFPEPKPELNYLAPIGPDSFFVSGTVNAGAGRGEDWFFGAVRPMIRHAGLLPEGDTLVCPGTVVPVALDNLAGMYDEITWSDLDQPVPAEMLIGQEDTFLRVLARNAAGCLVFTERIVKTDKFQVEVEVDGSTCGLPTGRIFLKPKNAIGVVQASWFDGNTALAQQQLTPGVYPVTVSDDVCSVSFTPAIGISPAPLPSGSISVPGTLFAGYGWQSPAGEITRLTDGTPVYWHADADKIILNYSTPVVIPGGFNMSRLVALPDTTFMLLGAGVVSSKMMQVDRYGQALNQYDLPFSPVDFTSIPGGGYLVFGSAYFAGPPYDQEPVIARLDEAFQMVWITYLSDPGRREYAHRILLLPDGRIAVAVVSQKISDYQNDLRISVLGADGTLQWSRWYGGEDNEYWNGFGSTPDGGLIVGASTSSYGGDLAGLYNGESSANWFFRASAGDGSIIWNRIVPSGATICFRPDGAPVFSTTYPSYNNGNYWNGNERLTALDPLSGDTLWSVRALDTVLIQGAAYYSPEGDIYWPHLWWDNYWPGPSDGHCCPSAHFHLQVNVLYNGDNPQPFELGPDTTLCIGDTLTLSAAAAGVPVTWQDNVYTPIRDIAAAGIYIARAGNVCAFADTIRVDYCLYPPLPDSLTGCSPLVVEGGMPGLPHQWSNGDGGDDTQLTESGWLGLTVTSLAGQTVSDSVFVTVYPPSVYETSEQDISCFGGTDGLLLVTPSGENAPYQYAWSGGQSDSLLTGLSSGIYTLTVTDVFGCTFTSYFLLTQPAAWDMHIVTALNQDSTFYTAEVHMNQPPVWPFSALWSNGPEGLYTISYGGVLSVTVTDSYGCMHSDTVTVPFIVGLKNLLKMNGLWVQPNPAYEFFRIGGLSQSPDQVVVRDLAGRELSAAFTAETGPDGTMQLLLRCGDWPGGVYAVTLQRGHETATLRMVKIDP